MKFEISLFKFDCKSDYLPYYTPHFINIKDEKNLLDILNTLNKENKFSFENNNFLCLCINGIYTSTSITCEDLFKHFGTDIKIEPLSTRRSYLDLLIDDEDFQEKLLLFNDYLDEDDKINYQSYKMYFYASNTLNFAKDYIGDAFLLLASDIIEKNNSLEKDILNICSQVECGIEYHTSLKSRIYDLDCNIENKINKLKNKLIFKKQKHQYKINKNLDFGDFEEVLEVKHDFANFNIAYFEGLNQDKQTKSLLNKTNAKVLKISSLKNDLALDTFSSHPIFTYKIASSMMLDAFDNSADLLIVDDAETFNLLDSNRKELETYSGRDIILPILHKNEFSKLIAGKHSSIKQNLSKHNIDPELI